MHTHANSRPKRISDADLHYWGDVFVSRGLARFSLDFEKFLLNPQAILASIERTAFEPLLPAQRRVRDRLDAAAVELPLSVQRLVVDTETRSELHGQALVEPMRHHSYKHTTPHREARHANRR